MICRRLCERLPLPLSLPLRTYTHTHSNLLIFTISVTHHLSLFPIDIYTKLDYEIHTTFAKKKATHYALHPKHSHNYYLCLKQPSSGSPIHIHWPQFLYYYFLYLSRPISSQHQCPWWWYVYFFTITTYTPHEPPSPLHHSSFMPLNRRSKAQPLIFFPQTLAILLSFLPISLVIFAMH